MATGHGSAHGHSHGGGGHGHSHAGGHGHSHHNNHDDIFEIQDSTKIGGEKIAMKQKALMAPKSSVGMENMSFDNVDENMVSSQRNHEMVIAVDFQDKGNFPFFDFFVSIFKLKIVRYFLVCSAGRLRQI